ncbi:hypothetical protein D3C81_1530650 [compost metagenome]
MTPCFPTSIVENMSVKYSIIRNEPSATPAKEPSAWLMRLDRRTDQAFVVRPITGLDTTIPRCEFSRRRWKYSRSVIFVILPAVINVPQGTLPFSSATHSPSQSRICACCCVRYPLSNGPSMPPAAICRSISLVTANRATSTLSRMPETLIDKDRARFSVVMIA